MSSLADHLADYLRIRRGLGAKLDRPERDLREFVADMAARHQEVVTVTTACQWAVTPRPGQPGLAPSRAPRRIEAVRGFATYLRAIDDAHEVPPADGFVRRASRTTPHIWSADEINALMAALRTLRQFGRHITYPALFGLLIATGMRVGEALHLDCHEVDLDDGVVTVTWGKSRNPRLVPLHPTTTAALRYYDEHRPGKPPAADQTFFTHDDGGPLPYCNTLYAFHHACQAAGLDKLEPSPRIHDLRHTFAVNTLLDWQRDGMDINAAMPILSAYMGHINPKGTYWYLTAVPELMSIAANTLAEHGAPLP
jgi:integrase